MSGPGIGDGIAAARFELIPERSSGVGAALCPAEPGDPLAALACRHARLCAEAVDALEIAAGLEAAGTADRAAREEYGATDVFELAEWLFGWAAVAGAAGAGGVWGAGGAGAGPEVAQ